jgi:hypothetical protein
MVNSSGFRGLVYSGFGKMSGQDREVEKGKKGDSHFVNYSGLVSKTDSLMLRGHAIFQNLHGPLYY